MNENLRHLDDELLQKFHNHALEEDTYLSILEHISSCEECSVIYSNSFTQEDNIICSPHYLKSSIMERILQDKKKAHRIQTFKKSIDYQWFTYSLKVGFAMCAALLILFSGVLSKGENLQAREIPIFKMETIDEFNNKLYKFSSKLMMEESYYDKEKK